jgi:hypothetical protein
MHMWKYTVTEKPRAGFVAGDSPVPSMWTEHLNEMGRKGWELVQGDGPYFLWKMRIE